MEAATGDSRHSVPRDLQWPGKYLPAIKYVLRKVPLVEKLFEKLNTPFEVGWGANKSTVMGDSTTIFGGFLRWIVEEVSTGNRPSIRRFLRYRSDIDISIDDHPNCSVKLMSWFSEVARAGGVIEYAGMTYGEQGLAAVDIEIGKGNLYFGNYMVWIPIKLSGKDGDTIVSTFHDNKPFAGTDEAITGVDKSHQEREIIINRDAAVRTGVSFADAIKSKLPAPTVSTPAVSTPAVSTPVSEKPNVSATPAKHEFAWVKIDISYGCRTINTDFTANALQWPKNRSDSKSSRYIADIIDRRIVPLSSDINVKTCYRLIKLFRRGYTFGIGHPSDKNLLAKYLQLENEPKTYRKQQERTRGLIGSAFTCDTSSPSRMRDRIMTTRHPLTQMTVEYVSGLREFGKLCEIAGVSQSEIANVQSVGGAEDDLQQSGDAEDNYCKYDPKVEVTENITYAYKLAEIVQNGQGVCIEFEIPIGTRFIRDGDTTRYERADIAGVYAYPTTRVNDIIRAHGLKIVSSYNKNFVYANGEVKRSVVALNGKKEEPLTVNSRHGIHTYSSMIEAWDHYISKGIATLETITSVKDSEEQ